MLNKSTYMLLVTASSLMILSSGGLNVAQAANSSIEENEGGFFSRVWSSVKQPVANKAKAIAHNTAEKYFNEKAGELSKVASTKFQALVRRQAGVHVVNDQGQHAGYIEDMDSRGARNLIKKLSGVNLDECLPGVPTVATRFLLNKVENSLEAYVKGQIESYTQKVLPELALYALTKAGGLAANTASEWLQKKSAQNVSQPASPDADEIINSAELTAEEKGIITKYTTYIKAKIKQSIHSYAEEAVEEAVQPYAKAIVGLASDKLLAIAESGATVTANIVCAPIAFVSAPVAVIAAATINCVAAADQKIGNAANEDSYLRQGIKWLTNFDTRKATAEARAEVAVNNAVHGHLDTAVKKAGLGKYFLLNDEEMDLIHGKHEMRLTDEKMNANDTDEDAFVELAQTEKAYSTTEFASDLVKTAANKVKKGVNAAAKANAGMALGDSLSLDEPLMNANPSTGWWGTLWGGVKNLAGNTAGAGLNDSMNSSY